MVVVGIGVVAEDALARAAGLECDNGIVVDEFSADLRSGDFGDRRLRPLSPCEPWVPHTA